MDAGHVVCVLAIVVVGIILVTIVHWRSYCHQRLPTDSMTLDQYRPKLGDLILTRTRTNRIETVLFPTTMTHVAVVFPMRKNASTDDTYVIEAALDDKPFKRRAYYRPCDWTKKFPIHGVRALKLSDYVRTYPGIVYLRQTVDDVEYLRPKFESALREAFGGDITFDTDIMTPSAMVVKTLLAQFVDIESPPSSPRDKMFCSEFVAWVLQKVGMLSDSKPPWAYWQVHFTSRDRRAPTFLDPRAEVPTKYFSEVRLV